MFQLDYMIVGGHKPQLDGFDIVKNKSPSTKWPRNSDVLESRITHLSSSAIRGVRVQVVLVDLRPRIVQLIDQVLTHRYVLKYECISKRSKQITHWIAPIAPYVIDQSPNGHDSVMGKWNPDYPALASFQRSKP